MIVELDIGDGAYVVRIPSRATSLSIRDEVVIGDGKIQGVGAYGIDADKRSGPGMEIRVAFDALDFDPDLAASIVRHAVYRAGRRAGLAWYRMGRADIQIHWRRWREIPQDRRRAFVERLRTSA